VRLLLDTHILLWWFSGDRKLSDRAREVIGATENNVGISVASLWEIGIKKNLGRVDAEFSDLEQAMAADGIQEVAIRIEHAKFVASLELRHRDPFDRMLIAQAIVDERQLVTVDRMMLAYEGIEGFAPLRV